MCFRKFQAAVFVFSIESEGFRSLGGTSVLVSRSAVGSFLFPRMKLEKLSPCKVNLLLYILGKRPDGYHELETVMHPVDVCDRLEFSRQGSQISLSCNIADLPVGPANLVYRAAAAFLERARISEGVKIHLDKRIPLAAGLGGGSGNAAATLLGLNALFGAPLATEVIHELAAALGSDIPFFLDPNPALATGRGEKITQLQPFKALQGCFFLLLYPGFGVPTAWAYKALADFPSALRGKPGRAAGLIEALNTSNLQSASAHFFNSLEAPVLHKYPLLQILQEFLRENGAPAVLMSGSGSTTFAILESEPRARATEKSAKEKFGDLWTAVVPI